MVDFIGVLVVKLLNFELYVCFYALMCHCVANKGCTLGYSSFLSKHSIIVVIVVNFIIIIIIIIVHRVFTILMLDIVKQIVMSMFDINTHRKDITENEQGEQQLPNCTLNFVH